MSHAEHLGPSNYSFLTFYMFQNNTKGAKCNPMFFFFHLNTMLKIFTFLGTSLMYCWSFMFHRKYAIDCLYLLLCPLHQTFLPFICRIHSQIRILSLVPIPSIAASCTLRFVGLLLYFIQLLSFLLMNV